MKKSLLALALLGAFAGVAHAQSAVTIYGTIDAGVTKKSESTLAIGKRDNNKLGFKGTEELGNGLKATFQLEVRYEPDTGTPESTTRPLFQGESRVGLQGDFGQVRLGRGLTAYQASVGAFDPWNGVPSTAGYLTDILVAGYATTYGSGSGSAPLDPAGNSGNRFSNAIFYNSPEFGGGFQANVTVGAKEANGGPAIIGHGNALAPQYAAGAEASATPYSLSGTYKNANVGAMLAFERNAVETKIWSIAGSVAPVADLKLTALYARQNQGHTLVTNATTKAWVLGANYTVGAGKFLAGYGQKSPDGLVKTKQFSLGYEYSLSKRTYVYVEASQRKQPSTASALGTSNFFAMGVHHNF